jgi:hypothetical protein
MSNFLSLKIHDEAVNIFISATASEMSIFWASIIAIDATLDDHGVYRQDTMIRHQWALEFIPLYL